MAQKNQGPALLIAFRVANPDNHCPNCREMITAKLLRCSQCGEIFCNSCTIADPDSDGSSFKCPSCKVILKYPE